MSCCTPETGTNETKKCCSSSHAWRKCCALCCGLIMAAVVLGAAGLIRDGLRSFQTADRSVSVRGLATQEVEADLAVWSIRHAATSNVLETARAQLEADTTKIRSFLKEQGLPDDSVSVLSLDSQDLMAQSYRPDNVESGRYVLTETLIVRSNDVEKVGKASQNVNLLLAKGVVLSSTGLPTYVFTKLNDVKPAMIAAATQNARASAEQFAKDSGQKIGEIRSASQGYFEIQPRDQVMDIPETAQRHKIVRVVTSVDYYLE